MSRILMLLACLLMGPLAAETIGNVEYHLPKQGKDWKVANELKDSELTKSLTLIYIPEDESRHSAKEFFAAHVNHLQVDHLLNPESLEQGMEKGAQFKFTNPKVKVSVLEQSPQSALYEYTISEDNQEKAHGWIRAFSGPQENVMLTYQTEQIDHVDQIKAMWIQALQNAKKLK